MAAELVSGLEYMHAQSVIHPSGIISHPSLGIFSFTPFRFYFRCALWPPNSFLVSNTCTRSRSSTPPVSSLTPPSVSSHSHRFVSISGSLYGRPTRLWARIHARAVGHPPLRYHLSSLPRYLLIHTVPFYISGPFHGRPTRLWTRIHARAVGYPPLRYHSPSLPTCIVPSLSQTGQPHTPHTHPKHTLQHHE